MTPEPIELIGSRLSRLIPEVSVQVLRSPEPSPLHLVEIRAAGLAAKRILPGSELVGAVIASEAAGEPMEAGIDQGKLSGHERDVQEAQPHTGAAL
jgi:hypothetical protein